MAFSIKLLFVCIVLEGIYGYGQVESVQNSETLAYSKQGFPVEDDLIRQLLSLRNRRQAVGPPPPNFSGRRSSGSEPFIPKLDPPPPGSILTYDGKAISTSIGAYSIVPKSERRTPSINRNRPQYATFRGELPPPIPEIVPRDLPQFQNNRGITGDFSPRSQ